MTDPADLAQRVYESAQDAIERLTREVIALRAGRDAVLALAWLDWCKTDKWNPYHEGWNDALDFAEQRVRAALATEDAAQ